MADVGLRARPEGDQEYMQSLAKGLAVIEAFGDGSSPMTLSEVTRRVGLSAASARRVLRTLQHLGYASCSGARYQLTPRILQLGYAYLSSIPLPSLVRPRLTELTAEIDGNCSVSVLDGLSVVFVARATAKRVARDYMAVGSRFPAHATSAGKALLASLPDAEFDRRLAGHTLERLTQNSITSVERLREEFETIRRQGYAINDQETLIGHRSIAVPIVMNDAVVAALGVGVETGVMTVAQMVDDYLPRIRDAAAAISRLLVAQAAGSESQGRPAAALESGS